MRPSKIKTTNRLHRNMQNFIKTISLVVLYVCLWRQKLDFFFFFLPFCKKSVGLFFLRVSLTKEDFCTVPEVTLKALLDCKHSTVTSNNFEDSFIYHGTENIFNNSLFFFIHFVYLTPSQHQTHPPVNACLSRWMSCLLFPRALITSQRICFVLMQSEMQRGASA